MVQSLLILKSLIYYVSLPLLKRVLRFKDLHKGETVYILGDSAEIKYYDLSHLDDHPVICFNQSFMINEVQNRNNTTYGLNVEPLAD